MVTLLQNMPLSARFITQGTVCRAVLVCALVMAFFKPLHIEIKRVILDADFTDPEKAFTVSMDRKVAVISVKV